MSFSDVSSVLSVDDEHRLRELATGIAKDIEEDHVLLARLGFTREDYDELCETRTFREMLTQALSEWQGASNTHKRIKLKAAVNVEQALPHFYHAMIDPKESLSSKVKALEVVSRIGGLGNPELIPAGGGQYFKLEINLGGGRAPLVAEFGTQIEATAVEAEEQPKLYSQSKEPGIPGSLVQSKVWDDVEQEEL